jgi:hypothetical protein
LQKKKRDRQLTSGRRPLLYVLAPAIRFNPQLDPSMLVEPLDKDRTVRRASNEFLLKNSRKPPQNHLKTTLKPP